MLWIYFLLTLVSLVITLVVFYDMRRMLSIATQPTKTFIGSYLKTPRVGSTSTVYVYMYTEQITVDKNPTLSSILTQNVHTDGIFIVPRSSAFVLPTDFTKEKIAHVSMHPNAPGSPISAFVVPMYMQSDENTKIIVVYDGVVYGRDFVEAMVNQAEKTQESIIAAETYDIISSRMKKRLISNKFGYKQDDAVRLASGVLFTPKVFGKVPIDEIASSKADDYAFSTMVRSHGIPIENLKYTENKNVSSAF